MADAFISYSRKDKEFAHRLQETLTEHEREIWLDTRDIPPTAEWLQEIYAAIEKSDAFVFVISPDSTLSEICQLELAHAVKHHKRLIPILRREADQRQVPEPLPQLNWLFFREEDDFEGAFQTFLSALSTDLEHVRAHTRLLTRARDWEGKGWDRSLLLRGRELKEAEAWLAAGGDKEPQPTDLMHQFLLASRQGTVRRRRILLGSVSFALLVAVILALAALSQYQVAQRRDRIALSRQLAAQANKLTAGKLDLALLLSVEACRVDKTLEARSALLTALGKEPRLKSMLHGHTRAFFTGAFSPDGNTLVSGGRNGVIILWDPHSCQGIGELEGHQGFSITTVAFSPDGKILASAGVDGTIILWDLKTHKSLGPPLTGHKDSVMALAFSPDGKVLASASSDKTIILWDPNTRKPLGPPLTGPKDGVRKVTFSPDGQILASVGKDNIILWDPKTRQPLGPPLTGHQSAVWSVAFSPDGQILASAGEDKTIILWDLKTQKPLGPPLKGPQDEVRSLAFSPGGQILASVGEGIILWDVKTRRPLETLLAKDKDVGSVAFSPDGQTLASGGENIHFMLWDVKSIRPSGTSPTGHTKSVHSLACSPDGKLLASASEDKTIILWDLKTRQPVGPPLKGPQDEVSSLAFSPDGKILASAGLDASLILWDPKTRTPLGAPLKGNQSTVWSLAFSPDGQILASGGGKVILWDLNTRKPLDPPVKGLFGHPAFSPDGRTLAIGGYETILWDLKTHQPLGPPLEEDLGHPGRVTFSPTGQILARIHAVRGRCWFALWNLKTRKAQLGPEKDNISSLAFSPDGQAMATGGDGIIFWDMTRPLGSPPGGDKTAVNSVVFTPDGQTLVSGNEDGSVRFYDGSLQSWIDRAGQVANRNLTYGEWKEYLGDKPYRRTFANLPEGEKDD